MSDGLKHIELIERYCEGKMDSVENISFENRLLIDSELKEELELYKLIVEGIKEKGTEDLKTRLKVADLELDANPTRELLLKPKNNNLTYWSIAASILLVIGIGYFWQISKTNNLSEIADTYYEKDKGLPNEMSISKNQFNEIMQEYKGTNYEDASKKLELLQSTNPTNDTVLFYNSIVKYELGNYQSAKESFNNINSASTFYQKAQFRRILIELKLKNKSEALRITNECLANKNHLYFEKLSKLKKELSE